MDAHPGGEDGRGLPGEYVARRVAAAQRAHAHDQAARMGAGFAASTWQGAATARRARAHARAEQVSQLACGPVTLLLVAALAEYGQWAARRGFGSRAPARLGLGPTKLVKGRGILSKFMCFVTYVR